MNIESRSNVPSICLYKRSMFPPHSPRPLVAKQLRSLGQFRAAQVFGIQCALYLLHRGGMESSVINKVSRFAATLIPVVLRQAS